MLKFLGILIVVGGCYAIYTAMYPFAVFSIVGGTLAFVIGFLTDKQYEDIY